MSGKMQIIDTVPDCSKLFVDIIRKFTKAYRRMFHLQNIAHVTHASVHVFMQLYSVDKSLCM